MCDYVTEWGKSDITFFLPRDLVSGPVQCFWDEKIIVIWNSLKWELVMKLKKKNVIIISR
jgi:hypothetical protein